MARNKNATPKNKSPNSRRRRARKGRKLLSGTTCALSPVSQAYLSALLDPQNGPLVGVPDGSAILTKKYRVWARGTMTTGTTIKDLAIHINPWGLLTGTQTVVGWQEPATVNTLPNSLNTTNSGKGNAPFSLSDLSGSKVSARLVSCQVKLRYAGTELNQGGSIVGLQEPAHSGLQGKTVTDLLAHSSCKRESVIGLNGRWFTLEYKPADVYDTYFVNGHTAGTNAYDAVYTADGVAIAWDEYPFMSAYVTSPVASQPWEYEVWGIVEYAGSNVQGKTLNPPDTAGFHCVVASIAQVDEHRGTSASQQVGYHWEKTTQTVKGKTGSDATAEIISGYMARDEAPSSGANMLGSVYSVASSLLSAATPYMAAAAQRYGPSIAAAARRRLLEPRMAELALD